KHRQNEIGQHGEQARRWTADAGSLAGGDNRRLPRTAQKLTRSCPFFGPAEPRADSPDMAIPASAARCSGSDAGGNCRAVIPTARGRRRGRARLFVPCFPRLLPGRGATPLSSHWTRLGEIGILQRLSDMGKRLLPDLIKEYRQLVAEVARLQAEVDRELPAALAALPATYGYADMDSFIKAVIHACRQPRQQKAAARTRTPRAQGKRAKVAVGVGMAKAEQPVQQSAEPPRPIGTSLDDPKN